MLCLLPGLLCDATVWRPQIEALRRPDAYVPDFCGLDSFEAMACRVLDETEGPLDLAGHSMGGRVALEVWRQAPERVRRLALLSTGARPLAEAEIEPRSRLTRMAYEEGMDAVARAWLPPLLHPSRRADPVLVEPLIQMVSRVTPECFEQQQRAGLGRPDARGYLPQIACPALVLVGRQDHWSPVEHHAEMADAIPGARLVILEDCGHMPTVERPDQVSAAMAGWLAKG